MHRKKIINLLLSYNPENQIEKNCKFKMLEFINKNKECFERSLQEGHITASAWLVDKNNENVLLMHHSKLGIWVQLGGHCDGESDVLEVALKEAKEESGIKDIICFSNEIFDIDVHYIPASLKEKEHWHYDIRFLLKVNSDEKFIQNSESKELRWIPRDINFLPSNEESILRMFNKWIKIKRL